MLGREQEEPEREASQYVQMLNGSFFAEGGNGVR